MSVERAAEVLAEHQRLIEGGGPCLCGEWPTLHSRRLSETYLDHLTDALAAAGCLRDDEADLTCICGTGLVCQECRLAEKSAASREGREMTVWTVAYDGEPKMSGGNHTIRQGEFRYHEDAERAFVFMASRSGRSPKPNMRIESRILTDWTPVTDGGA